MKGDGWDGMVDREETRDRDGWDLIWDLGWSRNWAKGRLDRVRSCGRWCVLKCERVGLDLGSGLWRWHWLWALPSTRARAPAADESITTPYFPSAHPASNVFLRLLRLAPDR